jgi:hypothetical protein
LRTEALLAHDSPRTYPCRYCRREPSPGSDRNGVDVPKPEEM